jgi:hypothetical protein
MFRVQKKHKKVAKKPCVMLGFTVFSMCKQKNTNMLQNKDIAKIQEIKNLFKDSWTQADFFKST